VIPVSREISPNLRTSFLEGVLAETLEGSFKRVLFLQDLPNSRTTNNCSEKIDENGRDPENCRGKRNFAQKIPESRSDQNDPESRGE
jgi:hypothetical protein